MLQFYMEISPFSSVAVLSFNFSFLLTSFCFWYFLDRHDRRDLKIQKHIKSIVKISDIAPMVLINLWIVNPLFGILLDTIFPIEPNWKDFWIFSIEECILFLILMGINSIISDFLFFWTHRILHINPLYRWFHKMHHELHSPIAFGAIYCHWVEHVFCNLLSTLPFGFYIQNAKYMMFWQAMVAFKTCQGHSGYDFSYMGESWNLHDLHHERFEYNYGAGSLMVWDVICNTKKTRDEVIQKLK